ncbi:hypothetical protein DCCM_0997 [Desulfocucumis palustris]|uniref:Uncharacterized protein n=1 Tax=Desulfocucumis palustris TaxID=1898651 RepID=A0A2L2XFZ9_9FIRM|nr:hypothetical protein DCCM_0997 [Desulfocucumis palustris]
MKCKIWGQIIKGHIKDVLFIFCKYCVNYFVIIRYFAAGFFVPAVGNFVITDEFMENRL